MHVSDIDQEVAARARAFGMTIVAYDPFIAPEQLVAAPTPSLHGVSSGAKATTSTHGVWESRSGT